MAGTAVVTIQYNLANGVSGAAQDQASFNNLTANEQVTAANLTTGANTITIPTAPTTPTGVIMYPPAGNTQTITVKGITGDTGLPISPTAPFAWGFPAAPPANFVLTVGGNINGFLFRWV